jgi:hypothetical protein
LTRIGLLNGTVILGQSLHSQITKDADEFVYLKDLTEEIEFLGLKLQSTAMLADMDRVQKADLETLKQIKADYERMKQVLR